MGALAEKLRAIAIVDSPSTTDEAAIAYAGEFGNKRIYHCLAGCQVFLYNLLFE